MSNNPLDIRRLNTCTFDQASQIWNEGFQGYFVDMTVSLDEYIARFHNDGLSAKHSLLAFSDGKPAGFLLNGIRTNNGKRVAWNGGTGVSPEFRGQGVGRVLVEAALKLYAEEAVDLATLEALSTNDVAIALYQKCGYETIDRLVFLEHHGPLLRGFSSRANIDSLLDSVCVACVRGQSPVLCGCGSLAGAMAESLEQRLGLDRFRCQWRGGRIRTLQKNICSGGKTGKHNSLSMHCGAGKQRRRKYFGALSSRGVRAARPCMPPFDAQSK
jgi:ribosomal protein S18 acetylase RimI-like enzyme